MPSLALVPLIARRQMFAIGSDGLRFTPQEVYDLAQLQGNTRLSQQEAAQLNSSFEGWIAGILLGSRLGYSQFQRSAFPSSQHWGESALLTNQAQLMTYVEQEVFKHEMPTYEFLKNTSIFTRLTPEHCNALLGIHDATTRLSYAEQRGLFVVRDRENEDPNRASDYICHPVLRQLFAEHLQQQDPTYYRELHHRATILLRKDHQYGQALAHACQAQEYDLTASIILEVAPSIVDEEQDKLLLDWLKMLPERIFKQHPQLLVIASTVHLKHGQFALAAPLLDTANTLLQAQPIEDISPEQDQSARAILQAELNIAQGHLYFFRGDFQRTLVLCQQALDLLPPDAHKSRIRAHQYLGISLVVGTGKIHEGITQLQQALQMSRSLPNEQQTATLHRLVANAYSWIGNHALAEYHQTRAFQIWENLNNSQGIIYSMTSMGLLKMRQGFTQDAEEMLKQALDLSRETYHFQSGEAYALVALGELQNNLGRYIEALSYLEDCLHLARDCNDQYLITCSLCNLAIAYLFMHDTQTAQFFLEQVQLKESENNSFEQLLFHMTQGTVYLEQQDYDQAQSILLQTADNAARTNIQVIYINALLRLAICYVRQGKQHEAIQTRKRIIDLNNKGDFESFIQTELRRYPELQAFLDHLQESEQNQSLTSHAHNIAQEIAPTQEQVLEVAPDVETPSALQILALGEPKVIFNGNPITRWRMARAMELFFFLLESEHPMRKEQITLALWPENDSTQVDSTVRTTIYYLRKALGENSLVFQSGLYSLNPAIVGKQQAWYDVEVFNTHYKLGKKALEEKDIKAATSAFNTMVSLYRGDYVQSFYNDWCLFRRDKLRQNYMDAHHQLALIAWQQDHWEESLQHWQHLLTVDSCNETAHYGIMRCYLRQGKRELALRQFQRCSQRLQEELQVTPGTSLQKLYQSITA